MPLHRDIYWIGRQWAVTGHGLQAVNQKRHGAFDIEVSQLWEDGLVEALCAQPWFNPEDFIRGLVVARERYKLPSGKAAPAPLPEIPLPRTMASPKAEPVPGPSKAEPPHEEPTRIESPKPVAALFAMRIERAPAKFTPLWRIAVKR